MRYKFSLLIFCLLFSTYLAASAERILHFDSYVTINKNASIDVTEVINVHANEDRILHGIVRRLPIYYPDSNGIQHNTYYQLRQVLFNNQPLAYHIEVSNHQLAIYMGDLATQLTAGNYVYTLRYHVNDAIHFLQEADEFYWNVTGNEWDFPIEKASMTIILPPGIDITHYAGYTGTSDAQDQHFTTTLNNNAKNQIIFITTKTLMPGENFIVAIAWPKGFILPPTWSQQIFTFLEGSDSNKLMLLITLFALGYFLLLCAWYQRGMSQKKIMPINKPPLHLSPAALRFIYRMGNDDQKTFSVAIIDMLVKQCLAIENKEHVWMLKPKASTHALTDEENKIASILFADQPSLIIDSMHSDQMKRARHQFHDYLNTKFNIYFLAKWIYLIPGILFALSAFTIAIFSVIQSGRFSLSNIALLFLTVIVNVMCGSLLKKPTLLGRKLMDHIAGFKLFLTTPQTFPTKKTVRLYECYLPYAIALGVEKAWRAQFNDELPRTKLDKSNTTEWLKGWAGELATLAASSSERRADPSFDDAFLHQNTAEEVETSD